ncbi:MAG: hypothetical protein U0165_02060 [Polyangiaceae bacterium]
MSSPKRFEYRVCSVQDGRVTWVNGQWQGKLPINTTNSTGALQSCPQTWDYLAAAGADGWELVASAPTTFSHNNDYDSVVFALYLKRTLLVSLTRK